jgi:cell division protein FtsB
LNFERLLIWFLAIMLVISQYQLWFGNYGVTKLNHLRVELNKQQEENNRFIRRNEALHAELQELKQGQDALEERARDLYGLIKEGEIFLQEVKPSSDKSE